MPAIDNPVWRSVTIAALTAGGLSFPSARSDDVGTLLTGKAAFGGWHADAPLLRRKIGVGDLPPPYASKSADNPPRVVARPASAVPSVPPGFKAELLVSNLRDPRALRVAPNGDILIAESEPGRIRIFRDNGAAQPRTTQVFALGLDQPFGMAFYPVGVRSALALRRQYRLGRSIFLSQRGPQGAGATGNDCTSGRAMTASAGRVRAGLAPAAGAPRASESRPRPALRSFATDQFSARYSSTSQNPRSQPRTAETWGRRQK